VLRLLLPEEWGLASFLVLVVAEIAVPVWAERARTTPWHPHHIAERYSLFTLILLGESVLASASAVIDALAHVESLGALLLLAGCGLVLAAGMWWAYFAGSAAPRLTTLRSGLVFGYSHYLIFAAAGAFSAGIEVAIDVDTNETGLGAAAAAATVTVPVAIFLLGIWAVILRPSLSRAASTAVVAFAALIGLAALAPASIPIAAVLMVALIVLLERTVRRTS